MPSKKEGPCYLDFYAKLPAIITLDDRLTKNHFKVLIIILSYLCNKDSKKISRADIQKRTNIQMNHVSRATRELESFGWLKKQGNGGRSKWSEYQFDIPSYVLNIADSLGFNLKETSETVPGSVPLNSETVPSEVSFPAKTVPKSTQNGTRRGTRIQINKDKLNKDKQDFSQNLEDEIQTVRSKLEEAQTLKDFPKVQYWMMELGRLQERYPKTDTLPKTPGVWLADLAEKLDTCS